MLRRVVQHAKAAIVGLAVVPLAWLFLFWLLVMLMDLGIRGEKSWISRDLGSS